MQDLLQQLPSDFQLQIYDLFLALRAYQRRCHFHTICAKIQEDIDQDNKLNGLISTISGAAEIDMNEDAKLRDNLPTVIFTGYYLMNFLWDTVMDWGDAKLSMCSIPLNDSETDIQVLRLNLSNDGWAWDAIYDIHTFQFVKYITNDYSGFLYLNMRCAEEATEI